MTISLYDTSSQSIQTLGADAPLEVLTAPVEGGPGELSALRQAVLSDVLRRQLAARQYRADPALAHALEALARGALRDQYEPETLRLWLLEVHYRLPLTLAENEDPARATAYQALDESERRLAYLYATRRRVAELPTERIVPVQTAPSEALLTISDALRRALENDLNSPQALVVMEGFLVAVNAMCDAALRKQGHVNQSAVEAAEAGFVALSHLLGLGADDPFQVFLRMRNRRAQQRRIDVPAIERKVKERAAARASRDFARADSLQAELSALGVSLLDGTSGTSWTLA